AAAYSRPRRPLLTGWISLGVLASAVPRDAVEGPVILGTVTITLITGANKGLGRETARRLLKVGHTVLVGARDGERGRRTAGELGAVFLEIDPYERRKRRGSRRTGPQRVRADRRARQQRRHRRTACRRGRSHRRRGDAGLWHKRVRPD